jgi:hypothetical protein
MSTMTKTTKVLLTLLVCTIILVALSLFLAHMGSSGDLGGSLMFDDMDLSDSVLGWMIAIPILLVTLALVVFVMLSVGVMTAVIVVLAVAFGLVAAVFGILFALLPVVAFFAVPVLIIWGIVKLASRNAKPRIEVITLPAPTQS